MTYKEIPRFTRNANYRINVDWPYLEKQLQGWIEEREVAPLNIDPEFQRAHVWRPEQQSAYVEYILRGGISGREIYFNCIGWNSDYRGPFVLVDGKQRLEAVRSFLRDEVPVFGGHKCSQIEGRISPPLLIPSARFSSTSTRSYRPTSVPSLSATALSASMLPASKSRSVSGGARTRRICTTLQSRHNSSLMAGRIQAVELCST